jgi:hypothetical protein
MVPLLPGSLVRPSGFSVFGYPRCGIKDCGPGWSWPDDMLALVIHVLDHPCDRGGAWQEALLLHESRLGWTDIARLVVVLRD